MLLLTILNIFLGISPVQVIDGYSNHLSGLPGDSLELYFNASQQEENFTARLFDLNGIEVAQYTMPVFPQQPQGNHPYENGFKYKLTAKVALPQVKSGIYLWENQIPVIIKARNPKIVIVYSSNTENAYANSGGKSLYGFNSTERAPASKVSFLRPIALPKHSEAFLRWMVNQPFEDVGYINDKDMDSYNEIKKASLLIIPGHSEYWTLAARKNFDRFVGDGKDALVLSGNTMWWQVRYNKAKNQMICYKKMDDDRIKSSQLKTVNWNDPTLGYPILRSLGVDFSLAGYGRKADKGWDGFKIVCQSPLLENTGLKNGDLLLCASDEVDGAPLLGFDHSGLPRLNKPALGFDRVEIVGYDLVARGGVEGVATWIVFKATKNSGIVINTASTDWCSVSGIGINQDIQTITVTMITKLLKKENVFSPSEGKDVTPVVAN